MLFCCVDSELPRLLGWGGVGGDVELFQKCANISSRALISERVSAACSVCLGGALLALLLSQRWIDFNPHNARVTFIQRCKCWAHVCVNGPLGVRHAASRRPASGRGSVKSPLFSQDREKARAAGRTASLHFLLSSTHALLQALWVSFETGRLARRDFYSSVLLTEPGCNDGRGQEGVD